MLDAEIAARSAEVQALLQGCRQLEAGERGPCPAAPAPPAAAAPWLPAVPVIAAALQS